MLHTGINLNTFGMGKTTAARKKKNSDAIGQIIFSNIAQADLDNAVFSVGSKEKSKMILKTRSNVFHVKVNFTVCPETLIC